MMLKIKSSFVWIHTSEKKKFFLFIKEINSFPCHHVAAVPIGLPGDLLTANQNKWGSTLVAVTPKDPLTKCLLGIV